MLIASGTELPRDKARFPASTLDSIKRLVSGRASTNKLSTENIDDRMHVGLSSLHRLSILRGPWVVAS